METDSIDSDPIADAETLIAQGRAGEAARALAARLASGRGGLLARLTLVKAFAELHGGRLELEVKVPAGSV